MTYSSKKKKNGDCMTIFKNIYTFLWLFTIAAYARISPFK